MAIEAGSGTDEGGLPTMASTWPLVGGPAVVPPLLPTMLSTEYGLPPEVVVRLRLTEVVVPATAQAANWPVPELGVKLPLKLA